MPIISKAMIMLLDIKYFNQIVELFSFLFWLRRSADRDKSISSKSVGEKQKPEKQAEQNEAANAADQAQAPKSNAPMRRWLNCFSCCTLCR